MKSVNLCQQGDFLENRNWRYSGVIMFSFEVALEMTEEIINPHSLSGYL